MELDEFERKMEYLNRGWRDRTVGEQFDVLEEKIDLCIEVIHEFLSHKK